MKKENNVILVDEYDNEIGVYEKLKAHEEGRLHRAFSIFVFNSRGELLLQRRAIEKYHSGGLWTNTVCSHPHPGEDIIESAKARLMEEMGFRTEVHELFSFLYKSDYENGLTEHEFDHVFIGYYNDAPAPVAEEVMDYKWIILPDLVEDMRDKPDEYTSWFKLILENNEFLETIKNQVVAG